MNLIMVIDPSVIFELASKKGEKNEIITNLSFSLICILLVLDNSIALFTYRLNTI